ncbi:type I restriction enzyme S subunit [Marinobacter nauticus]|uniref:Type I restriction enzyme S subunit n=1 Tax=Marinobacter nauticus TaxID=2743 RepID=A0A368XUY7_MARNT|nr:restriction endonuclease subunit S [Marinobacter nauticus]RCW69844.1 type I restriction enzyme S subunit [Marinobacter nauticus]
MSSKTVSYRLGDLTDWLSGGTPSKKNPEYWGDDIPWISASSMGGSRYSSSDLKITKKGLEAGSRLALEGSILLLVRGSTLHNRIPVGIAERDVAFNQDVKAIRVKPKLIARQVTDEMYVYYWLKANEQRLLEMVEHTGIGAGKLDTKRLQNLEIHLPSWPEQRKIVASATAIDEKEILNSRINQTLEQVAQAIFKSWFVDFEPVKAKIAALEAGGSEEDALLAAMQAISGKGEAELTRLQTEQPEQYTELRATAELFPSAMQESELGEIPEGWGVSQIGDLVTRIPVGKKYSQKTASETGEVPVLDQGKSGIIGFHNEKPGVTACPDDPVIVFANHTCYMRLIMHDFSAIQNVLPFKSKSAKALSIFWLYFATLGKQEFIEYKGHWPDFVIKEIVVPDNSIASRFGSIAKDLVVNQFRNDKQNETLSAIRDAMLPKLLSGELSVADFANQAENAEASVNV